MNFSDRLLQQVEKTSAVVLGIDPNFELMPSFLWPKDSSSRAVQEALVQFSRTVIDACDGLIPAVKLQSAYFEQFGVAGVTALSQVLEYSKQQGLLTILDVKRGDIGSTSLAYALAYLQGYTVNNGFQYMSDLEADCITINPFLGDDSLVPFVETAVTNKKGLFILVKTSNPGSSLMMDAEVEGRPLSHKLAELVTHYATQSIGTYGFGDIGAVVGATCNQELSTLISLMPNSLLLMPGLGAQGGSVDLVKQACHHNGFGAIVPVSRGITYPQAPSTTRDDYQQLVRQNAQSFITQMQEKGA